MDASSNSTSIFQTLLESYHSWHFTWSDGITVVTFFASILIAIWLYRLSDKFNSNLLEMIGSIEKLNVQIGKIARNTHTHSVATRLDIISFFLKISRDDIERNYWHFKWRFETFDNLYIQLTDEKHKNQQYSIKILGQNGSPMILGFEQQTTNSAYIVKINPNEVIDEIFKTSKEQRVLIENEVMCCFTIRDQMVISRSANHLGFNTEQYGFVVTGLGEPKSSRGERLAKNEPLHLRLKDLDPTV